MTDEPTHKSIKVRHATYRLLRRLAAEQPETMAALLDRLVLAEQARRKAADSRDDSQIDQALRSDETEGD